MIYENLIKTNVAAFKAEVIRYCRSLGINPDDLMVVMYAESRINEKARNPKTRATGLIQFMPSTAIGLGTTVEKLYAMSNVEQLYYVYKYFQPYAGKIRNVYDLYKIVFFPAMIGKPATWVLQTSTLSAELIARQNAIIDINKNGSITVAEFEAYVSTYLKKKLVL
ncbi:MAG: transglycosylase SLT domain-containing protein [Paludibacter sp.]